MEDQHYLQTTTTYTDEGEPMLPLWQRITKGQAIVTGTAFVVSGAADVAMHFDKTGMFFGLLAVGAIAKHSDDIAKWLVPGAGAETHARIVEATQQVVNTVSPAQPMVYVDQSAQAKLKRLFGFRSGKNPGLYLQAPVAAAPSAQPQSVTTSAAPAAQPAATGNDQAQAWKKGALKWGVSVRFGRRFDPLFDNVFGRGVLLTGTQGAGKSNLIGSTILSAARNKVPCFLVDYKNEFYPLREMHQTIISCGHPDYAEKAGAPYYAVTPDTAAEFAHDMMEWGVQAIFNIQSYRGDFDEMAETLSAILHELVSWALDQESEEDRPPCLVVTDEAHNLTPENPALSALPLDPKSFKLLKKAYVEVANAGRSFGYTQIMATQRLANIAKWSVANLNIQIVMKQDLDRDIERCEDYISKELCKQLRDLPAGQGFVRGLSKTPMLVQFDQQEARHVSKTPDLARAQKRYKDNEARLPARMRVGVTEGKKRLRPDQTPAEREISRRYARNATSGNLDHSELENTDVTPVSYARNNAVPSASEAAVSGQNSAVTAVTELPTGWDEKKLDMLSGFYIVFNSLDDALKALQLSTSQKNRDFARTTLKQQGLWKETK